LSASIEAVKERLIEWGTWARRDNVGLGYPSETPETKYATREQVDKSRRWSSVRKVADAAVPANDAGDSYEYMRQWWGSQVQSRVMSKRETFMPDDVAEVERAITRLPSEELRLIAVMKYVVTGLRDRERAEHIGMSKTTFSRALKTMHLCVANSLQ